MVRFRLETLKYWKTKKDRKPLMLRGARQVGKTWLIREFGKTFDSLVEINLESQTELIPFFEEYFGKAKELTRFLSAAIGAPIIPGKTLLFLDEIQEVPKAILALRYFKEQMPDLHVIAAGSLIEFALKDLSFPVGRMEFLYLFPMTFKEYLLAIGKQDLVNEINSSSPQKPLPNALHTIAMKEISRYSLIGGMPEVVKAFAEERELRECQAIQQSLVANFRADFNKYASKASIPHLRIVFDAIPRLLGKKLKYSQVSKEFRSRELKAALLLLEEAGLIYRAFHSSGNGIPLNSESKPDKFKAFFIDVGLCQRVLGLEWNAQLLSRATPQHRGNLAEQLVAQELVALTDENDSPRLFYWHRDAKSAQAEVDFLLESKGDVLPIEVKSGTKGALKSLYLFMQEKKSHVGIKISENGFAEQSLSHKHSKLLEIPFYGVGQIKTHATRCGNSFGARVDL